MNAITNQKQLDRALQSLCKASGPSVDQQSAKSARAADRINNLGERQREYIAAAFGAADGPQTIPDTARTLRITPLEALRLDAEALRALMKAA